MDLLYLVDRLEELVAGAQRMPIGGRAIVDRRRLLDLIDQMRVAIPDEVRQASEIVAQTSAIRRDSEEEARLIVARAEEQTARLLDEHHVTRSARLRAEEIAENAERQLDDSEMTLRDLRLIGESFKVTLRGVYHPRIEYPEPTAAERQRLTRDPLPEDFKAPPEPVSDFPIDGSELPEIPRAGPC